MQSMLNGKRVLTIDDADTIRSYLKSVLMPLGALVDGAATAQDGIALCTTEQYDLILLDLILPDADGIEVLQRIRATNTTSAIVMLTSHGGIKSAISAVQLGADGYLQKQEMTATVRDHFEFTYALEQAFEHRAGLVAQQQLAVMRADFYSMVTHDLRNPASTVNMALDMLLSDDSAGLTPSQLQLVDIAHYAISKMVQLVNDYLDYAKIDAGYLRIAPHEVDLRQVVESSAQLTILQARARNQTLTLDLPPEPVFAVADGERLKQVLDNLLSNACKYTPNNGSITVQLRVIEDQAIFSVSDSGVGIPREQLSLLFTKYYRVMTDTTRSVRGTGLGLLIVKEIIEAHGGGIRAESEGIPDKGTRFIFNIPLQPTAQTSDHGQSATPQSALPLASMSDNASSEEEELYEIFIKESRNCVQIMQDAFGQLFDRLDDSQLIVTAQRAAHMLKGNAGAMQFTTIYDLATRMDDILRSASRDGSTLTSVNRADLMQLLQQVDLALAAEAAE